VRLFEELHRSGTAVVVATHNDALVRRFSHPVLTLTDSILHPSIAPASNGASNSAGQAKAKAAEAPAVRRKSG
jgi:cell division transport system ATP-binding protein